VCHSIQYRLTRFVLFSSILFVIVFAADTGVGASPVIPEPEALRAAGTIEVSIDGEASPMSVPSIHRADKDWTLMHPIWKHEYVNQVHYTHLPPQSLADKLALYTIKAIRFNFDWMSGYSFGKLTESKALTRIVFLETVAAVPGSIAGILRLLASLRRMKRDGGWINTLLGEAENERMHLLTFLQVRQPGPFMRSMVFVTQGIFFNFFWVAYLISPKFCHRLVGYLEEEAVVTYTKILHSIEHGELKAWRNTPAPDIAKNYWKLSSEATLEDVVRHVRADEARQLTHSNSHTFSYTLHIFLSMLTILSVSVFLLFHSDHRDVNHTLASLKEGDLNPFRDGHA
jgi:hypothetical protein